MKGDLMNYLVLAILLPFAFLFIWMIRKKITVGIWSIKVFKSNSIVFKRPTESLLKEPTLKASDVSDVPAEFVADPFIIHHDCKLFMFFEILDKSIGKGVIGLATSKDGEKWKYEKVVLKENFHLSYPYVFKNNDNFYMIPETSEAGKVLLYKASLFPFEWEVAHTLLHGNYVDSSIFQYEDKWWMLAAKSRKLHLFFSEEPEGEWIEHPKSPLISNNEHITRPGGRVIVDNDLIFRYTQDCKPNYGSAIRVFKITHLTEEEYDEEEVNLILCGTKNAKDWNRDGMHSIDQLKVNNSEWLTVVDGHRLEHKNYFFWKMERIIAMRKKENRLTIKTATKSTNI
ncbi:glucosamine inositolphosphorylceramide transferase family protein [Lederbergia panacisoli]|uniref:glucosamine inositolphosphorylceramide transferase family protein n=1 Tax=Lederbergia panacisoli TaxID=1255251 RepID=UPI00214BAB2B|nr:hypothetical protein [Lederbergia panacisoli]MCR2822022.1 hypothetical protein [Lederbergia panacisoli]